MTKESTKNTEEFKLSGEDLMAKVKEVVKAGNARRITIKDKQNKELMSFPLTAGVVGLVLAPIAAAVGVVAALATECTLVVEKKPEDEEKPK